MALAYQPVFAGAASYIYGLEMFIIVTNTHLKKPVSN